MQGFVSLIGAGAGDPDLLTLKALRAIQTSHVAVYDRLVSDAVMALVPEACERIFAGKSCKQKIMTQEDINALLISLAQKGKRVARLKGGDPLLFGRGGEEALALAHHGIPFEIIPGVSSAQACGAVAGIPLTHRGLATGVRFITGHRMSAEESETPLVMNWQSLADPDTTLVIYMGLANLRQITDQLMAHGLPHAFPAALIENGTTPTQRLCIGTLATIANIAEKEQFAAPTLVIIGRVVNLSNALQSVIKNQADQAAENMA